ncbi:MAG: hypothetical protein ACM33B_15715 [Pseudomonadota bacterium]
MDTERDTLSDEDIETIGGAGGLEPADDSDGTDADADDTDADADDPS